MINAGYHDLKSNATFHDEIIPFHVLFLQCHIL